MKTKKQEKIHQQCLKLLNKFSEVCDKYNLTWFADGGTLLGAIRKGKLIDWDDDVDVVMPREDYNFLVENCIDEFERPFFLQNSNTDNYFEVHTKIRLDGTTSLTPRECTGTYHRGMFLDIFPLDNVKDIEQAQTLGGFVKTIGKYSSVKYAGDKFEFCGLSAKDTYNYMNKILTDISVSNNDSEYIADVVFYRYMNLSAYLPLFKKEDYAYAIDVKLKGLDKALKVPCGYENILKAWYGKDWRIEKQEPTCHKSFVDPEKNYTEYKIESKKDFENLFRN